MGYMFQGATSFDQSLSNFNTAEVTNVSEFLCRLHWEPDLIPFPPRLVSDGIHVPRCNGLQPEPL